MASTASATPSARACMASPVPNTLRPKLAIRRATPCLHARSTNSMAATAPKLCLSALTGVTTEMRTSCAVHTRARPASMRPGARPSGTRPAWPGPRPKWVTTPATHTSTVRCMISMTLTAPQFLTTSARASLHCISNYPGLCGRSSSTGCLSTRCAGGTAWCAMPTRPPSLSCTSRRMACAPILPCSLPRHHLLMLRAAFLLATIMTMTTSSSSGTVACTVSTVCGSTVSGSTSAESTFAPWTPRASCVRTRARSVPVTLP
eukprot:TRINITY_DN14750_c0_g1::TRINITY_DN14750_c0_g1_i1::g.30232::m.30232 TRINITY_DN14750_c0_g1::TRINITY_DN14750_c0_g1_i1::g.30232  ORF type:complete len:261 (+),score=-29.78,MIP-T3/PF10243.4/2.4 TRINITY_DN14750_c0_g1_i1:984-1766(+)